MVFPESHYERFVMLSKEKSIVCFGAGRLLERSIKYLHEHNVDKNLIAIIDNDTKKKGQIKTICGNYDIIGFESLVEMSKNKDFFILVTSVFYKEIREQIKGHPLLHNIEVLDIKRVMEERSHHFACYTEIFPNMGVGDNGENLTISILMHDRAALTVRLIETIQMLLTGYKGKIIIGNNCSKKREIELVKEKLKQVSLDCKIFDFEQHYPIPQGKNMLNRKAETEWILQLDNDIYFTANPLMKLNEDIASLGCLVWGLPYYDTRYERVANFGSNLKFVKEANKTKRLECLFDLDFNQEKQVWKPMLCTYAAGCAFLFKKDVFTRNGGYDENLFVMEDIDLMYRLNMAGYKIGNIGMNCLVHDHKIIDNELGRQYERIRFDETRVYHSKIYLKKKYGFEV